MLSLPVTMEMSTTNFVSSTLLYDVGESSYIDVIPDRYVDCQLGQPSDDHQDRVDFPPSLCTQVLGMDGWMAPLAVGLQIGGMSWCTIKRTQPSLLDVVAQSLALLLPMAD